jgi:orotate phosphoribosyltransferase
MEMLPTQQDVEEILRGSGALRRGHFVFPNGQHSDEYLQVPLALQHYQYARTLCVGLSRLLRADTEIRSAIPKLSIVSPATGGLPVAYGVCEALRAKKAYWAEREAPGKNYRFRPFIQPEPGEQVVLVDDILHSGRNLADLKAELERQGAQVLALAVIVYQPTPQTVPFGSLPLFHLARLDAGYYADKASCRLCRESVPVTSVWL